VEAEIVYISLAALFGIFMAWGIGANDVANAMATSVGSRALTIRQAILVAAVFEFLGAVLAGGEVTSTIRKGIVDAELLSDQPEQLIYGMLASLLAAGTWLLIASRRGWPVSTTHSIVGAIVGFAAVGIGIDAVQWGQVGTIVMSWVVSPLTAGFIAYLIYRSVIRLILSQEDPLVRAKRYVPVYIFLAAFTIHDCPRNHSQGFETCRLGSQPDLQLPVGGGRRRGHRADRCDSDSAHQAGSQGREETTLLYR
jgi:PiT family inorganic phosphate transporter